jgi:uncharacterized metal-binding protein YceD (DUF177 family)
MDNQFVPLARLGRSQPQPVLLEPDAEARRAIAAEVGAQVLRKLRFEGVLRPEGKQDWRLEAKLGVTAVQPCVVTLEPVTTRIDVPVLRSYRADVADPDADEIEMPDDDTVEPLPATLDLLALITEAVALALPDYPRAPGVELGPAQFAAPGVAPMTDEDTKPLAGLAALRDKLLGSSEDDENKG